MEHRDLLAITDLNKEEIEAIFATARAFKQGPVPRTLAGMSVVLIFEKASTRTRLSFEAGIARLGGHPIVLTPEKSQMARGEPLKDTARILAGYTQGIIMRTFGHERIEELAAWAEVPVINALTDRLHPCQVLSDCFTLVERFGDLEGHRIAWVGDGNNMANSWINAASLLGFELALACPEGFGPDEEVMKAARARGARITLDADPFAAVEGALAVNTDVWASMGQEEEFSQRLDAFARFQVDSALMEAAAAGAVFMHCLPAHRGEEVTAEVLEGERSIVWQQAQNRLYVQESVMDFLVGRGSI